MLHARLNPILNNMFSRTALTKEYRADIDGLRALAILSVLLYHVDIPYFSGGFVGVDIFFVISGYLITRNILVEHYAHSFTLMNFYARRVRRLLPALFFTIIISFVIAILLFSPTLLERLAKSTILSLVSLSNFFFWGEAGYFDTSATFKPLLHTWSLAVEEQYYLVWPTALLLLLRLPRRTRLGIVALLFIASLWGSQLFLKIDPSAAFYMLPFRIFEFMIGAFLVPISRYRLNSTFSNNILYALAIALLIAPLGLYNQDSPFPGILAILPCLGTALAIYSGHSKFLPFMLRNPPSVFIGRISYSLYLVHWPVLVFYSYYSFKPIGVLDKSVIIFCSVILAIFLYYGVERPFRKRTDNAWTIPLRNLSIVLLTPTIAVAILAGFAAHGNGWAWRLNTFAHEVGSEYNEYSPSCNNHKDSDLCVFGDPETHPPKILLIGDSHADHYTIAMADLANRSNQGMARSLETGCPPLFDVAPVPQADSLPNWQKQCLTRIESWKKDALRPGFETIVLASQWATLSESGHYGKGRVKRHWLFVDRFDRHDVVVPRKLFRESMLHTVNILVEAGKKVIILGQVPNMGHDVLTCLESPTFLIPDQNERCAIFETNTIKARLTFANNLFLDIKNTYPDEVEVFIPSRYLCDQDQCMVAYKNKLLYANDSHINNLGSLYLSRNYMNDVLRFLDPRSVD